MLNRMDLAAIRKDARFLVAVNGAIFPRTFPELVHYLHVFFGDVVALVVTDLLVHADIEGGAVQIRRHDVPSYAALGEMIQGRKPAREKVRRFEHKLGATEMVATS
nr:hypothetical protein [Hyphomicrobium sp.]